MRTLALPTLLTAALIHPSAMHPASLAIAAIRAAAWTSAGSRRMATFGFRTVSEPEQQRLGAFAGIRACCKASANDGALR